jgi:predicted GNAT family acetyltransferase
MTETSESGRTIEVVDNAGKKRFEVRVDGALAGFADYLVHPGFGERPGKVVFTHTEVEPDYQGQGVAQALAAQALDQVRASGRRVQPLCPFIASYIRKHPEYGDLVEER